MSNFKTLLKASMKSEDTEEWIDVYFTRPVGLAFALLWKKLGVTPNTITILSVFLGMGAGWMFWHTDLAHNLAGVGLLIAANLCDSTDGQLARLTGQTSFFGRVIDGFAGDVWFFCIYVAIAMRLMPQELPGIPGQNWSWLAWLLVVSAGVKFHSPQSSLADYYRQIHLHFLKNGVDSELDNYRQQRDIYENTPRSDWFACLFYFNYSNYCHSQERRTPRFQQFFKLFNAADEPLRQRLSNELLDGSRPLMKYANILSFNWRAITLYASCLANVPWVYPLVEILVFHPIYLYMKNRHETLCLRLKGEMS